MFSRSSSATAKTAPNSTTWTSRSIAMIRSTIASRSSSPRRGSGMRASGGSV